VALPRILGYEVVERIRRQSLPTRTILVASVYNRTGYKRRPTSLYGADDYIEQHHIPDQLLLKIAKLLPETRAPRIGPPDPTEGAEIRRAGEGRLRIRFATREEGIQRAERLARLIVSDIALYNEDALDEGIRRGDLANRLREDLEEGRLLFDLRVPEEIRKGRDFIAEALAAFAAQRTKKS
jgi:CheY-like chemotaxis protein